MGDMIQQLLVRPAPAAPEWLHAVQRSGGECLQAASWPGRKTEKWLYLNLRPLEQGGYTHAPLPAPVPPELSVHFAVEQLEALRLVFVNGRFAPELSAVGELPAGVTLTSFADATADQARLILQHLNTAADSDQHLFAAANSSQLADGTFLHLAKNVELKQPVQLVWLTTPQARSFHVNQRLLVVLESNARAQVIEQFVSSDEPQTSFTNGVTELCLKDGARLEHYRVHLEEENALHIGGVHASLQRDAHLGSFHLARGSLLKRIDLVVNYWGPGARAELNGVYLPKNQQQVDYHTCVEHRVPHCTTAEVFRGIVADRARAIFNGRIHIHADAQKTLAQLSNKNLLTSDKAEVYTKPELEIYADDVQCAHGATVAQLDKGALHYMLTRGIPEQEARVMLSFGFINELINTIPLAPLADYLRPQLAQHFAADRSLMRHIA